MTRTRFAGFFSAALLAAALLAAALPAQLQLLPPIPASTFGPVYVADNDANGLPDLLLLTGGGQGGLVLLRGTAPGTFAPPVTIATAGTNGRWLHVADVDGDRLQDAVILGQDSSTSQWTVLVLRGLQSGGFVPGPRSPALPLVFRSRLADLDGDGLLDLVHRTNSTELAVQRGTGAGAFAAASRLPVWPSTTDLAVADLDGDGHNDIALAVAPANAIQILWGDGTGGFPTWSVVGVSGIDPAAILVEDANRDGAPDLLVLASRSSEVDVLTNDGAGNFTETGRFFTWSFPRWFASGDLDGDGIADLAIGHDNSRVFAWLRGDGAGNYRLVQSLSWTRGDPTHVRIADLDLDGRQEVLLSAGSIQVVGDPSPAGAGLSPFGTGTPGCHGGLGLTGNSTPAVGNGAFAFLSSNGPADGFGLVALATAPDPTGSDPFGTGALLHLSLAGPVLTDPFPTGAAGEGFAPAPIPPNPGLAGLQFYAQGVWIEQRTGMVCSASPLGLVTSRGLGLTIQP